MTTQSPLETNYKYTESLVQKQLESLVRLDKKTEVFIGFTVALIRLAIDIKKIDLIMLGKTEIHIQYRGIICTICAIILIINAIGLSAKTREKAAHPRVLIEKLKGKTSDYHYIYIIKCWIEQMDQMKKIAKCKQYRLNLSIGFFIAACITYAIGAI